MVSQFKYILKKLGSSILPIVSGGTIRIGFTKIKEPIVINIDLNINFIFFPSNS